MTLGSKITSAIHAKYLCFFADEMKLTAISHSIVQATRPRSVISLVLFGDGLDHEFGSKQLLNQLARLGFSITSEEVNRYKQSVVQTEQESLPQAYPESAMLDGLGTFHGMCIISMSNACVGTTGAFGKLKLDVCRAQKLPTL